MTYLLEPFTYNYMVNAMWVSALVGGLCAFLSVFLMLKGWSLIGDALSHAVVPGVVGAHIMGLPFALGAFFTSGLSAAAMLFISQNSKLKTDAVIGLIFTSFFAFGLFMNSLVPIPFRTDTIIFGNILAITPFERNQIVIIAFFAFFILGIKWKDLMVSFFDEAHARTIGLNPTLLKVLFFMILSASTVASMQTVGALLVVALVITPGATAYLLSDNFPRLILISILIGSLTAFFGTYISYFMNGATGGVIIVLQTLVFLTVYLFAPKHGVLGRKQKANHA